MLGYAVARKYDVRGGWWKVCDDEKWKSAEERTKQGCKVAPRAGTDRSRCRLLRVITCISLWRNFNGVERLTTIGIDLCCGATFDSHFERAEVAIVLYIYIYILSAYSLVYQAYTWSYSGVY